MVTDAAEGEITVVSSESQGMTSYLTHVAIWVQLLSILC